MPLDGADERKRNTFHEGTNDFQAEGGGRVKRRLSRTMGTRRGCSDISTRMGAERRSGIRTAAGGCSTKKSLAMTLAVKWEEAEGTQEVSSQGEYRGKRFARTTTRENAQIHAATHWMRVGRRGRGVRSDSIGTPPSETPYHSYSTPVRLNASQPSAAAEYSALNGLARVLTLLHDCDSAFTACRKRRCIHWRSAYRRADLPVWGRRSDW